MKKLISLLLACLLTLGLIACGGSQNAPEAQPQAASFQAGFGRADITLGNGVGMGGYSDNETRLSKGTLDPIYVTCIALSDGNETVLAVTIDVIGIRDSLLTTVRTQMSSVTGVPMDKIFVGATHTHSGPAMSKNNDAEIAWHKDYEAALRTAAKEAMEDMAPAKLQATTKIVDGMNFVRHYLMNDGTYYGSNFGSEASGYKAHATENDPQMVLVKLERENKKDILMVNWQAHPASVAREVDYNMVSADFVGYMRVTVEQQTGMHFAYFTGASGNQNKDSKITSEKHGMTSQQYGPKMAEIAIAALADLKDIEDTTIKSVAKQQIVQIDHSWDHMINEANEVYDLWKTQGKTAGDALGAQYGFTSSYQARAIRDRKKMSLTGELTIGAFRVGPIGFTHGTYEMFSDHSNYVKENSPFEITFLITGNSTYIPSSEAYDYRSYEADTGFYAQGTGEQLAKEYVNLLNTLK